MATPSIGVRLSPEGVQDVINAFRRMESEGKRAGKETAKGIELMNTALASMKGLLVGIAGSLVTLSFTDMIKKSAEAAEGMRLLAVTYDTSVKNLSALNVALKQNQTSLEDQRRGLSKFFLSTSAAARDAGGQAAAVFRDMHLTREQIEGFSKQDLAQRIEVVGGALRKLKEGPEKTSLIMETLGARATKLIPIFERVGAEGFEVLIKDADSLSALLSDDVVNSASAVEESMERMGIEWDALATKMTAAMSKDLTAGFRVMTVELAHTESGWTQLGAAIGRAFGGLLFLVPVVVDTLVTNGKIVVDFLANAGKNIADTLAGRYDEVKKRQAAFMNNVAVDRERLRKRLEEAQAIHEGRAADVPLSPVAAEQDDVDASARTETRREKEAAAEKKRKEAEAKRILDLRDAQVKADADVARARGDDHLAAMISINEEVQKTGELLEKLGESADEVTRRKDELRAALVAQEDFNESQRRSSGAQKDLDQDIAAVQEQMANHIITQKQGNDQILKLERERLPLLEGMAAEMLAAANALGDQEKIRAAEAFQLQVVGLSDKVAAASKDLGEFGKTLEDSATQGFESFLNSGAQAAESIGGFFKSMASSVVGSVEQVISHLLALRAVAGLFGLFTGGGGGNVLGEVGGVVNAAEGGLISGPGTGTSDSIPARLSAGEFVVPARAVATPGVLPMLEHLRAATTPARASRMIGGLPGYATGGLVQGGGSRVDGTVTVALDPGLVAKELETPAAQRMIVRAIQKNKRSVGSVLGR